MENMKFMIGGKEVDISHHEAKMIAEKFNLLEHHETNEHYQDRAFENICEAAKQHGIKHVRNDEADMKELMVYALRHEDEEMLGELIEWFIADHAMKVGE